MGKYRIEVVQSAERALGRLPRPILPKVLAAIQALSDNPYPHGCRKLAGEKNVFRIRVNVYRVLYEIHSNLVLVKVLKIGHRKDVYH